MMDFGLVVPLNGQFAYFYFDNQDGGQTWQGPAATFGTVKQVAGVGGTLDISENLAGIWVGYDGTEIVQYSQQSEESGGWAAGPTAAAVSAATPDVPTVPPTPPIPPKPPAGHMAGAPAFSELAGAMVVPFSTGQLVPYTRQPSDMSGRWSAGTPFGSDVAGATLIVSSYDNPPDQAPSAANEWDVVALQAGSLTHYSHDSHGWHTGETFASGAAGRPGFIQSSFGTPPNTNFEVVVPMAGSLQHFWRANAASGTPWVGPTAEFGPGNATAVALIQSSDSALHVVAAAGGELLHWVRAGQNSGWSEVASFASGASGAPGLIQFPEPIG
jgi:hypothetical protein